MAAFDALVHLLHRCLVVLTAVGAAPEHETLGREGRAWLEKKDSDTTRVWRLCFSLYLPHHPLLHFPCETGTITPASIYALGIYVLGRALA